MNNKKVLRICNFVLSLNQQQKVIEMEKYRLKEESKSFFNVDWSEDILSLKDWNERFVHLNLLERAEKCSIDVGVEMSDGGKIISSADNKKGIFKCYVTITIQNPLSLTELDLRNGLIEKLQQTANEFYK